MTNKMVFGEKQPSNYVNGVITGQATDASGSLLYYKVTVDISLTSSDGTPTKRPVFCLVTVLYEDGVTWERKVAADNEIEAVRNGFLFLAGVLGSEYHTYL